MGRRNKGYTEHTERRQAACDPVYGRTYTDEEFRFLQACERYRQARCRRYLTACDYLAVLRSLGYRPAVSPGG